MCRSSSLPRYPSRMPARIHRVRGRDVETIHDVAIDELVIGRVSRTWL